MKRVALHIDFDWLKSFLTREGYTLTPSLLSQGLDQAAFGLGVRGGRWVHANWMDHPASLAESFMFEGFRCGDSLTSSSGWDQFLNSLSNESRASSDLTVVLVSGNNDFLDTTAQLREYASELVVWHGMADGSHSVEGWDRVDSVERLLRLRQSGSTIVVDFGGLMEEVGGKPWAVDVETILERIDKAVHRLGAVTQRIAFADWHRLPVLRDREGNPVTHETERLCSNAGYRTLDAASPDDRAARANLFRTLETFWDQRGLPDTAVLVGDAFTYSDFLESPLASVRETHIWSRREPENMPWVSWQPIEDVFTSKEEVTQGSEEAGHQSPLLPGLWSRVGLFMDRLLSASGTECIAGSVLSSALSHGATYVKNPAQTRLIISLAVNHELLLCQEKASGRDMLFALNQNHPEVLLIRDLLQALLNELGEDPGQGEGAPLAPLMDRLLSSELLGDSGRVDKNSLRCWMGFLVDEGILLRFKGADPALGSNPVTCIAFCPVQPASTPVPEQKSRPRVERSRRPQTTKAPPPTKSSGTLREHLIIVMDNYAVRHGKQWVPHSAIRRQLAGLAERVIEAAIREGVRQGDFLSGRQGTGAPGHQKGGISLNEDSRLVRQTLSRKDRIIGLLRHMAPMGQPMGEARIRQAMVQSARLRNQEEAALWLTILQKERLLKRERQIVTESGPSYVLSLDDPVVTRLQNRYFSRESGGRGKRRTGTSGSRGLRRRNY